MVEDTNSLDGAHIVAMKEKIYNNYFNIPYHVGESSLLIEE